jgi:hypothetical protein
MLDAPMYRALPARTNIMQRLHRFFDRSDGIEAMNLIEIDRIDSERRRLASIAAKMRLRDNPLMFGRSTGFGAGALPPMNARSTG